MLKNGDVLAVYLTKPFSRVTKLVQWLGGYKELCGITHVGVAREINGLWYSQEMDGKHNVLRPIEQYFRKGTKVEVYRAEGIVTSEEGFNKFMLIPIRYSLFGLLKIGFQVLTRFKRNGKDDEDDMRCSNYAFAMLLYFGWTKPEGFTNQPSPAQLCDRLVEIGTL